MSAAAASRCCVIYTWAGVEHQSAWFTDLERAQRALSILRRRYGACILYRD